MRSEKRFTKVTWRDDRRDTHSCPVAGTGSHGGGREEAGKEQYVQQDGPGEGGEGQSGKSVVLNRTTWKGLTGRVALEWSPEGGEGKSLPGSGNCRCKGPGVGARVAQAQAGEEAPVHGAGEWARGRRVRGTQGFVPEPRGALGGF